MKVFTFGHDFRIYDPTETGRVERCGVKDPGSHTALTHSFLRKSKNMMMKVMGP